MARSTGQPRSTADSIRRVINIARIVGAVVLLAILVSGIVQLVSFYSNKVGLSAPGAAESYMRSLLEGDLDTVYAMTAPESITDLYGRPVQREAFMAQAQELIGVDAPPIQSIVARKILVDEGVHYYAVEVTFQTGAAPRSKRLLLQLRSIDGQWFVTWPFGLKQ